MEPLRVALRILRPLHCSAEHGVVCADDEVVARIDGWPVDLVLARNAETRVRVLLHTADEARAFAHALSAHPRAAGSPAAEGAAVTEPEEGS